MCRRAQWALAAACFGVGLALGTYGVVYDIVAKVYRKRPFFLIGV